MLESLPIDRDLIRESLDDVNIDVLDEEVAMQEDETLQVTRSFLKSTVGLGD